MEITFACLKHLAVLFLSNYILMRERVAFNYDAIGIHEEDMDIDNRTMWRL